MPLIVVDPRTDLVVNPDDISSMIIERGFTSDTYLVISMISGNVHRVPRRGNNPDQPLDLDAIHKKLMLATTTSVTADFGISFDESLLKQVDTPEGREMLVQLVAANKTRHPT